VPIWVIGSGRTVSSSGTATARSGAISRSASAAGPRWVTRRWATNRPRTGAGTASTSGKVRKATERLSSSGAVAVHRPKAASSADADSPGR
jgi:hypothetical protein